MTYCCQSYLILYFVDKESRIVVYSYKVNGSNGLNVMRYVVFDVETTGLFVERGHRIIEIGAIEFMNGLIGKEFHSLIDIGKPVSKAVQKIHGITTAMLAGQPQPQEVFASFRQFIGDSTLVAHNADFDVWFLRYEYWRLKHTLSNPCRCTLKLSRKRYPGLPDYKLETVAKHVLGIEVDRGRRHRALDDARLTARIWIEMRRK